MKKLILLLLLLLPISVFAANTTWVNGTYIDGADDGTNFTVDLSGDWGTNLSTAFTHTSNASNPHNVTAAQIGLGAVENTTLSTWAGSANITTLGTITTGTWNATAIADDDVDNDITLDNITQITARSHTLLSDIGNNTHAQIDGHISNTSNPHTVTAAQIGLGAVENTTLSTWAGSANITILGTIATGTWNATALTDAKIADNITINSTLGITTTGTIEGGTITEGGNAVYNVTESLGGDVSGNMSAVDITESIFAVGGSDTIFPADPNDDKYLFWNDTEGALEWATPAGSGDIESVFNCTTGACEGLSLNATQVFNASNASSFVVKADSIALTTDTTGNYVQTIADSGSGTLLVTNGSAEGGAVYLTVNASAHNHTLTNITAFSLADLQNQTSDVGTYITNKTVFDKSFTLMSPNATTDKNITFWRPIVNTTISSFYCSVDNGTSCNITIGDGSNPMNTTLCNATGVIATNLANNTYIANETIQVDIDAVSGTVDSLNVNIRYTQ